MESRSRQKLIWSWALYDWANSAFATTVMAGFFPLFFKQYWSSGFSVTGSTYLLGLATSFSSFILAAISPALGAIADEGAYRKRFLFGFTAVGVLSCVSLGLVPRGGWMTASIVFAVGNIGFTGALTFYDALLVQIVEPRLFDRTSALGYALGYLGGGLLFALNVVMYLKPQVFGFSDAAAGVKASFISVGLWWAVFSLPIFYLVKESSSGVKIRFRQAFRQGTRSLLEHFHKMRGEKSLLYFLAGYLFYIDAVNTIARMAVDYGMSIGLDASDLIKALLLVQFIGFPSAVFFGYVGDWIGPKRGIWICLVVYFCVTVFAYRLSSGAEFYALAAVIGIVQGGIQSLSRSYFARLVPPDQSAQYFGFFNMIGKFSSVLGPVLIAAVGYWRNDPRSGILVLTLFFLAGGLFLLKSHGSITVKQ